MAQINSLLDNVEVIRADDGGFKVRNKGSTEDRDNATLSSGEAELVSLAIEVLAYAFASEDAKYADKTSYLLFDEPDVHLHPDLQKRLMDLVVSAAVNRSFTVFVATHSTAIVASMADRADVRLALMGRGEKNLQFEKIDDALREVLPIFGAHPLSNVFNDQPILLVEGEDDVRIWQQAVRSSELSIRIWPCAAGDIQSLSRYEDRARSILESVYDDAEAFSLRDRDGAPYEIDDTPPISRARLMCRAAENLLLSDDVLNSFGTDWVAVQAKLDTWLVQNDGHPTYVDVSAFKAGGWDRMGANVKSLRNLVPALVGSQKPWEVAVGQAIAALKVSATIGPGTLTDFLGPKAVSMLALHP